MQKIFIILSICAVYLIIRVIQVDIFKKYLAQRCYDICEDFINKIPGTRDTTNEEEEQYDKLLEIRYSIENISVLKMLFSLKPLSEEYWLNEEQLNFFMTKK